MDNRMQSFSQVKRHAPPSIPHSSTRALTPATKVPPPLTQRSRKQGWNLSLSKAAGAPKRTSKNEFRTPKRSPKPGSGRVVSGNSWSFFHYLRPFSGNTSSKVALQLFLVSLPLWGANVHFGGRMSKNQASSNV